MSSSIVARRGLTTALTVLAAAVLLLVGLRPGSAGAAETKGSVVVTVPSGKLGRVAAVSPAKVAKRIGKKGAKVKTAVAGGNFAAGNATNLRAKGGIKLKNGKRSLKITGLKLALDKKLAVVRGNALGKKNIVIFTAAGKGSFGSDPSTAKFTGGKLKLQKSVAKKIRKRLKLKKAPTGKIGSLYVNARKASTTPVDPCEANPDAEGCPIVDPYLEQCDVAATSKVSGSLPAPAALPTLSDPEYITSLDGVAWGFKSSFRSYVIFGAQGSMHGLDGATTVGGPPVISGFDFPVDKAEYSDNGTGALDDDQMIVETHGTAVFCATAHKFRVAISDPTFVIDGDDSRIIATVDTNLTGVWTQPQRIDLANLDLGEITQTSISEDRVDWGEIAASFTQNGADAICGTGEQAACDYAEGTGLDPVDLYIHTENTLPVDQYNAQCGVPVDSVLSNSWPAASALPTLTGAVDATTSTGTVDWGFLGSFRSYVTRIPPPGGSLQGLDGATHDGSLDGGNHMVPPLPLGFSFPQNGVKYAANTGDPDDDQAIVNSSGTALFCKAGHFFWFSISDPTVVIDGENSRIVATVSQNTNGGGSPAGPWQTPQRIDLADLDLSSVTPTYGPGTVTWTAIPATVSDEAGSVLLAGMYQSGDPLDPITVSLETE